MSLIEKMSKWNWGIFEIGLIMLLTIIGWAISMEVRLAQATNINNRIKNIEELLYPMLVEWEVEQRIKKMGIQLPETEIEPACDDLSHVLIEQENNHNKKPLLMAPEVIPQAAKDLEPRLENLEKDARQWAQEAIMSQKR